MAAETGAGNMLATVYIRGLGGLAASKDLGSNAYTCYNRPTRITTA